MKPVSAIALRRIRRDRSKSILFSASFLILTMMISFFATFYFRVFVVIGSEAEIIDLPIRDFMSGMLDSMALTAGILLLTALLTVYIYTGLRREDNRRLLSVLTCIGATGGQKNQLIFTEIFILYFPPVAVGTLLGIFLSHIISLELLGIFTDNVPDFGMLDAILALIFIFLEMLILTLCSFISVKRVSVISSVKNIKEEVVNERHGYRYSKTFKSMSLLKRLAKKSVDHYRCVYRKISLSFALSAVYPIVGLFLFSYMMGSEITVDSNPYDCIDTSAAVMVVVNRITVYMSVLFLALTAMGVWQTLSMVRMQTLRRWESAEIYLRVGLDGKDFGRILRYEQRSVVLNAIVMLIFAFAVINALYFTVCD